MERSEETGEKKITLRWKRITSFAIWFCSFSFGLAYSFLSPALVEIKNKYNTDIDEISVVFTVILVAYLVAALISGVLFDYVNRQLLMVAYLYIMAAGVIAVPYCPTKIIFFVVGGIIGFACGGVDTSQVVWMLEMWEGEAGLYIQSQYAFFALGTTISPLLLRPFLLEEEANSTSTTPMPTTSPSAFDESFNMTSEPKESQLYIPLSIGGGIIVTAATILFFMYFKEKYVPPKKMDEAVSATTTGSVDTESGNAASKFNWGKIILITLAAITLGCYQGMEITSVQFIPTFTHYVDLRLSEPDSADVLLGFTGAFALGRFMGIGLTALKVIPAKILIGNLVLTVIGLVLWLIFANTNLTFLWVGALILGLGFSTIFACIYDHIEKHIKITNMVAAIMIISGGLVSALYPLIIGKSVEKTPFILIYTNFFSVVMCTIAFSLIYYLTIVKSIGEKAPISDVAALSVGVRFMGNL